MGYYNTDPNCAWNNANNNNGNNNTVIVAVLPIVFKLAIYRDVYGVYFIR